jgi:hypothetical protein
MKALQSKLAKDLLADPVSREQMRAFLVHKNAAVIPKRQHGKAEHFIVRRGDGMESFEVTVVPKAPAAG